MSPGAVVIARLPARMNDRPHPSAKGLHKGSPLINTLDRDIVRVSKQQGSTRSPSKNSSAKPALPIRLANIPATRSLDSLLTKSESESSVFKPLDWRNPPEQAPPAKKPVPITRPTDRMAAARGSATHASLSVRAPSSDTYSMPIVKLEYEKVAVQNERIKLLASVDARIFVLSAAVFSESVTFTFADVIGIQYFSHTESDAPFFDFKLSVALKLSGTQPIQSLTILRLFCSPDVNVDVMASLFNTILPGRIHRLRKPLPYGTYEFSASRVPSKRSESRQTSPKRKPSKPAIAPAPEENVLAGLESMPSLRYQLTRNASTASPGTPSQSHIPQNLSSPDIFSPSMKETTRKIPRYDFRTRAPRQCTFETASTEDLVSLVDPEFDDLPIILFAYPEGIKGAVMVTSHDLRRLEPGIYLNDNLIDYELQYIYSQLPVQMQRRVFIYNSFFFHCLETQSFTKVRSWTRNVNIFERDFLVVPINEKAHWYVAVICFPAVLLETNQPAVIDDEKDTDSEDSYETTQPFRIFVFDSLGLAKGSRGKSVAHVLLGYLKAEAADKLDVSATLKMDSDMWTCPEVPQQNNFTDCGCFSVHYIEQFLSDPEAVFSSLLDSDDLSDWFPAAEGTARRAQMKLRAEAMAADYTARHANDPAPLTGGSSDIEEIHLVD